MYDNYETVHVDIEEFAAHIAKVRTDWENEKVVRIRRSNGFGEI